MVANADSSGPPMTGRADRRITRAGRLLRVTRLDELPQLWNVLVGDMSLVGPRPEVQAVVDRYDAEQRRVLDVKPGLTGPTQLAWLDESERYPPDVDVFEYYVTHIVPRKVESDLAYVRSRSLAADFGYLLKTPLTLGVAALGLAWGSPLRSKMGRLAVDCLGVAVANGLALAIWLEALGPSDPAVVHDALRGLVVGCLVYMLSFLVFQAYRGIWRYASDTELPTIVGACVFGGLLHTAALRLAGWSYPRSVLVLTVLLTILFMGGVRLLAHGSVAMRASVADLASLLATLALVLVGVKTLMLVLGSGARSSLVIVASAAVLVAIALVCRTIGHRWLAARRRQRDGRRRRVLIAGVGDTAPRVVRAMASGAVGEFQPVGFLDDDVSNRGGTIAGVQVLGTTADFEAVVRAEAVDVVVILFPHVASASLRHVVERCRASDLEYRLLPSLDRLLTGTALPADLETVGSTPGRKGDGERGSAGSDGAARASDDESGDAVDRDGGAPPARPGLRLARAAPRNRLVLVTGGAGYIGSHVVRKLLERGHRVRVVDSLLYGSHGLATVLGHPRLELMEGDVRHIRTMTLATKGVDAVIALAAIVGDAACELDADETLSTNLEATSLLAEACERAGVRRLVFASSCSVYGANGALVLNEGSWLNPVSIYARSRLRSEKILLQRADGLGVTILRLSTVFGLSPRMRLDLLVNTFTAHAVATGRIRVFGGSQYRPNLHVQDAAEAFISAAESPEEKAAGEIFNVGDNDQNHTVLDIARLVQAELPRIEVELVDASTDTRDYRVGFDKIQNVLGFRARYTVSQGIREMIVALHNGEIQEPNADVYHNYRYLKANGFERSSVRAIAHVHGNIA
jgi:nucleoside-diphosphate-sugar epimerase